MDLIDMVVKGVRKAEQLGASEAEVYIVREYSTSITGDSRGVESILSGESISAFVRVVIGKRLSVQGAMMSKPSDIETLVENAVKIARASPEDPNWVSLPKRISSSQIMDIVDEKVKSPDIEFYTQIVKEALGKPSEISRNVLVNQAGVSLSFSERAIGNSYSSPISYEKTDFVFGIEVKAVGEGSESSFHSYYNAPTLKEFKMDKVVEEATKIALSTLKAKPVETGVYKVVFTPRVFASILQALIVPAVRADMVQKKRSPLANKLFSEVLSQQLTVIDDGAAPNMPGSGPFDDEGVATKRKTVFDRGVLRTYLYDTYTANIDGRESTGNARRSGSSNTFPDATNIIVLPGTEPLDSIIRDVRRGIIVYGTIGEWLSNAVSGFLNATVTHGLLIEGGEVKQAVKGVVISGDIYKILKDNLIGISKEFDAVSNYLVPAIAVDGVTVAGEGSGQRF
ncbi:MAG: TldD/PmbA family protein [Ignisphaera sp.]